MKTSVKMKKNVSNGNTKAKNENVDKEDRRKIKSTFKPLPDKQFQLRNSLLIDLFETNIHIKTCYHIFVAMFLCLFINILAHDYLQKHEVKIGLHLIYQGFGKLHIVAIAWIGFNLHVFLFYVLFNIWAKIRIRIARKGSRKNLWDYLWLALLLSYYVFSLKLSTEIVKRFQLPPPSASILLLEKIRLLMKVHAFMRTNAERVVKPKPESVPKFSKFLYFLFAPTLIYKDEYPRTKTIRWNFIFYRVLEIIGCIFLYTFLFYRFIIPLYQDFGLRKFTWGEIIVSTLETSFVGMVILTAIFFLILHTIQNLCGEILRFGDRQFYQEWWTCTDCQDYFRTWNIVVHNWLYTYVYKDVYNITKGNKLAAKLAVFLLSAIFHEWVMMYMVGFFFPIMFAEFIFVALFLTNIKAPKSTILNILFWFALSVGSGTLVSMYTLEFFARLNLPKETESTWKDTLLPKWITCADCIG